MYAVHSGEMTANCGLLSGRKTGMIISHSATLERAGWLLARFISFRLLFDDEFCFRADTVDFMLQYCNYTRWRGLRNTASFPDCRSMIDPAPFVLNTLVDSTVETMKTGGIINSKRQTCTLS